MYVVTWHNSENRPVGNPGWTRVIFHEFQSFMYLLKTSAQCGIHIPVLYFCLSANGESGNIFAACLAQDSSHFGLFEIWRNSSDKIEEAK